MMLTIAMMVSCEKDEPALPGEVKTVNFIDVSSYTDWHYFSFSKGEFVTVSDYANDLTWDIAFHRGDVRLNGGASGKGQAEALNTNKTEWSAVAEAPTTGYIKDQVGKITIAFLGSSVTEVDQPFSQTLTTWLTVDTSTPPPKYTIHNHIYVLKAADGNYVKLWIKDNKDATNKKAG